MMKYLGALSLLLASTLLLGQVPQSVHFLPHEVNPSAWSVYYGQALSSESIAKAPDGTSVMQFTVTSPGGIIVQQALPQVLDLSRYDSFFFFIESSATRIGDFVYLVDANRRRRWFSLILNSTYGWRQPVYSLKKYTNQDYGFDETHVTAVRFGQSGQMPGDSIWAGNVAFANGVVTNSSVISAWNQDVGSAQFAATRDSVTGKSSIKATVVADAATCPGQVDVAINGVSSRIHWDWSNKNYIQFYFKNSIPAEIHQYFYWGIVCSLTDPLANGSACSCTANTCTINGSTAGFCDTRTCRSYREYYIDTSASLSGEWLTISADLQDPTAITVGNPALGDVNWFEVGIFGGPSNSQYTFEIGPVAVHE